MYCSVSSFKAVVALIIILAVIILMVNGSRIRSKDFYERGLMRERCRVVITW